MEASTEIVLLRRVKVQSFLMWILCHGALSQKQNLSSVSLLDSGKITPLIDDDKNMDKTIIKANIESSLNVPTKLHIWTAAH